MSKRDRLGKLMILASDDVRKEVDNAMVADREQQLDSIPKPKDIVFKNSSITYDYFSYEVPIICYAVTRILQDNNRSFAGWSRTLSQPPEIMSITTGHNLVEKVVKEATIQLEDGLIQTMYLEHDHVLRVTLASDSEKKLEKLKVLYSEYVNKHNFYQGKSIRFDAEAITLLDTPSTTFDKVVLPESITEEYRLNTVEFLQNDKLRSDSQHRSVILYGPPGCGKTSLISATFNELNSKGITCAYLTTDSFQRRDIETVIQFCLDYLCPMVLCFEDIDLIAYSRESGSSSIIGPLLSVLNGIEDIKKPLVFVSTTNRFDVLDSAVTRPCRIDRRFKFDYPTKEYVNKIFKSILKIDAPREILDMEKVTGSHIREVYRTAKILAVKNNTEDYLPFVQQAIQIVRDNFYLGEGRTGFSALSNPESRLQDTLVPPNPTLEYRKTDNFVNKNNANHAIKDDGYFTRGMSIKKKKK